jgi:hypothetical protein
MLRDHGSWQNTMYLHRLLYLDIINYLQIENSIKQMHKITPLPSFLNSYEFNHSLEHHSSNMELLHDHGICVFTWNFIAISWYHFTWYDCISNSNLANEQSISNHIEDLAKNIVILICFLDSSFVSSIIWLVALRSLILCYLRSLD